MSASGKSLLGLWLYRSGEQEWALKEGSPIHKQTDFIVCSHDESEGFLSNSEFSCKKEDHGSSDVDNHAPNGDRTSIIFTLKNQVGGLARALQVFQVLGINVLHVEFHPANAKTEVVRI
jgi:tryptophan 5-monooxygenase